MSAEITGAGRLRTVRDVVASPTLRGEAVVLSDSRRWLSRERFTGEVAALGATLCDMGVRHGDRVAVVARNSTEYVVTYYAVLAIGAVYVPLNWRLHPSEHARLMTDAVPAALVASVEFHDTVNRAVADDPGLRGRVILIGGTTGDHLSFEQATSDRHHLPDRPVAPSDTASIVYTSGTTSEPKGVRLTHDNVVFDLGTVATYARPVPGDLAVHVSPLHHQTSVHAFVHIALGAAVHLLAGWDPLSVLRAVHEKRATYLMLAPTMLYELMDHPRRPSFDLSSLRTLVYGAAPITGRRLRQALELFGPILVHGYGLTEATSHASYLTGAEHVRAEGSIGRGAPELDVEVVDEQGVAVPPGEVGEIRIRGRSVMAGYWGRPDATAEILVDGWLRSGDLARVDEDGYISIAGRSKDVVISGGTNIYPHDVENVLATCDGVAEVAVFGVPHPRWGEELTAVVVPRPGAEPSTTVLERHCRDRLGGYQVPKRFDVVPSLPRNASGKILLRELRQRYANGEDT